MIKTVRGFSLVEVIIATFVFTVLGAALILVLKASDVTYNVESGTGNLQLQARQAIEQMVRELRSISYRDKILIPGAENNITFQTFSSGGMNVSYYLENATDTNNDGKLSQVVRYVNGGARRVLANDVVNLTFQCKRDIDAVFGILCDGGNNTVIKVSLQAAKEIRGRNIVFNITEEARIRNK